MRPRYSFARNGERSIARAYTKAIRRARHLIYLEDQYLWSTEVANLFAEALRATPTLHLIAVVPRHPDVDGRLSLPPNQIGREQALAVCQMAAPDRIHVFDLENHEGTPVYVHAKVCVIDDTWCSVGSDNFNRRSWTHDSEVSCAILDSAADESGGFARNLRLSLMREHLDRAPTDDEDLVDPLSAVKAMTTAGARLRSWSDAGRADPRPPGRIFPHAPEHLPWHQRVWSLPAYRLLYDPDGRPWRSRRANSW
jgi:phosphatidylserine/phosphatidylglycerophosphate/cardiolipin synthase-like enzyme